MNKQLRFLLIILIAPITAQSFAMSRVLSRLATSRASVAVSRVAVRPATAKAFSAPLWQQAQRFVSTANKSQQYNWSRFRNTQKGVPRFSKARLALAGLLGTAAAGLVLYGKPAKAEDPQATKKVPWQSLKDELIKELKAEEKEIHQKILDFCGCSEAEWQKKVDVFLKEYADPKFKEKVDNDLNELAFLHLNIPKHDKRNESFDVDSELNGFIKRCIDAHGLNSELVDILIYDHPAFINNAEVRIAKYDKDNPSYKLYLSRDWHSKFIQNRVISKELSAIIHHEIQHLVNRDVVASTIYAVLLLESIRLKKAQANFNDGLALWKLHSQFFEKRADMLACLQGPEIALALANRHENLAKENKFDEAITHPLDKARSKYCMDLYNKIVATQ